VLFCAFFIKRRYLPAFIYIVSRIHALSNNVNDCSRTKKYLGWQTQINWKALYNELSIDSKQAGWLTQNRFIYIIIFQIVVVFFKFYSCFKLNAYMHGQFRAIWLLPKSSSQAMSEYSCCENVYPTFALWSKISHFISNFSCLKYSHIRLVRFLFKFLFRSRWIFKALFPSSDIQKIIQQCLQTIKLFRNAEFFLL
jgi:hypothetical protein